MDKIVVGISICMLFISVTVVICDRIRVQKIFNRIEEMLRDAMKGEPGAQNFDERRLSKLESELADFLSASAISARNVKDERDKIKSLISDISHQTKTPIANLILYSELLENGDLPEEAVTNVEAIHSQAEKLRFLIDSLVKLSRLENGILELQPRYTALAPVLDSVCMQFREKAEKKGIVLNLEEINAKAVFDEKWTQEAFANIVDNAIKYTAQGSVTISAVEYEMFTRIDIKDTGIGIPEEESAQVFQRFYRGKAVKAKEGAGIGLHLAREIVSGEGGYIKLRSGINAGTTFSVYLPKNENVSKL